MKGSGVRESVCAGIYTETHSYKKDKMRSVLNSDSEISDRQAALLTAASLQDVGGTQTGLVLTDERLWHIQSHGVRRV